MKKNKYPMREHKLVFALLMMCAGMMGAYTFTMRGGVFCNAQTANVVLMSIKFGQGKWMEGLYFLIPFTAYFAGAVISEVLCRVLKGNGLFKWSTYLIAVEMFTMLGIGFIPLKTPDQVVQVMINFLASMQFTAFRKAEGIPMATTFCTNHIRQMGISVATACTEKTTKPLKKGLTHLEMILFFFVGGLVLTLLNKPLGGMSIMIAIIPFAIVLGMLISGDIYEYNHKDEMAKNEKEIAESNCPCKNAKNEPLNSQVASNNDLPTNDANVQNNANESVTTESSIDNQVTTMPDDTIEK